MSSIVLALWRVGAILENGCEIQEQNYVLMFKGLEMKAGFTTGI